MALLFLFCLLCNFCLTHVFLPIISYLSNMELYMYDKLIKLGNSMRTYQNPINKYLLTQVIKFGCQIKTFKLLYHFLSKCHV